MVVNGPVTAFFTVRGSLTCAEVPALCERVRALLEESRADVLLCDVSAIAAADAVALDALARLQLTARRLGSRVRLCGPSDELRDLIVFTGLADACGLRLDLERQVEQREDRLGVEEERELTDPPA
jgi:anti-anti-sigma factor